MLRRLFYQTQLLTNCQFLHILPNLMIKCPSMCLQKAHKSFEVLGVHEVPVLSVANHRLRVIHAFLEPHQWRTKKNQQLGRNGTEVLHHRIGEHHLPGLLRCF